MEFRILGPVRVHRSGVPVAVRGRHHPRVLALLLEEPNRVVPVDRLIEALWEGTPPDTAAQQVQSVVSGLRRQLAPESERLARVGRGYRLRAAEDEVDLLRCKAAAAEARRLRGSGRDEEALEALRTALSEWDGPSLAGLSGRSIDSIAHRLEELRLSLLEDRVALELDSDPDDQLVGELRQLVSAHPLRQRFAEQLMLALYRSGRAPEALQVYTDTSDHLAAALGVSPGPPLRDLHVAILREDPDLNAPGADPPPEIDRRPAVPATLPSAIRGFTGRAAPLRALDDLLDDGPGGGLAAITGTGGIGKTTLAIHWAHRVADRFPDGQLYLDLRGFDPGGRPLPAAEAVGSMLEALGTPVARTPSDETARIGLYRSLIANRRVLVVLDNARDAAHARSLIPGGPGCFTVVTSRDQLSGLAATHSARPVILGLLDGDEAGALLERRLGAGRVRAEPEAARLIVGACAGLPLALAIASARAATRPDFALASIAAELRDARGNLDAFADGDPETDVRTVFSWSYRSLSAEARRMFRLLGLHPGPDCSVPAAAALAAVPAETARALLSELASAHLVAEDRPGRFRCHDLLRVYARELVGATETEADARVATERMLDHYVHNACAAVALADPIRDPITLPPKPTEIVVEPFDQAAAYDWFTAEFDVLLASVHLAAAQGFHRHAWRLAWSAAPTVFRQGRWHHGIAAFDAALDSAERGGDASAQIYMHRTLSRCRFQVGDHEHSYAHLDRALALCDDDQVELAWIHRSYGQMYGQQERYAQALDHGLRSLRIFQAIGHQKGEATLLNAVGWYQAQLGMLQEALDHCRRALEESEDLDDRNGCANSLDSLGWIHLRLREPDRAADYLRQAAAIFRGYGDRPSEAETLDQLGDAYLMLGRTESAEATWRRALDLIGDIDDAVADRLAEKLRGVGPTHDEGMADS